MLVIVTTLLLLILQRSILMRALPVLAVCAACGALTLIHPIDVVSKNYLVGVAFVACATVLAIASAPLALLRFSAAATVLSAVICLLDIFFTHGFTNTVGRAAGLSINANVAAAGLFLGAASSFWAVPSRLRASFLLIIGAAILVTLSRSTLLAATVVGTAVAADLIWARLRDTRPHPPLRWASGSILPLALAAWITLALFTNDRFSVAATSSFRQIGTSQSSLEEARDSVAQAVQAKSAGLLSEKLKSEEVIREIERRAENEGDINSISARGILMERAFLSYKIGPALGQGLGPAHALQPHNMFLLFAVAFGFIGWFVPLAFLALTAWWARSIQQLPLFLATFTVMMTSHDVLFTPALLSPIVFGIAGLIRLRHPDKETAQTLPALPYAAWTAPTTFAIGSIFIVLIGAGTFPFVPRLLLVLVFCAMLLWSAGIWHWRGTLTCQADATRGK